MFVTFIRCLVCERCRFKVQEGEKKKRISIIIIILSFCESVCLCGNENQSPVPAELSQPTSHTDYQHSRHRRPTQQGLRTTHNHTITHQHRASCRKPTAGGANWIWQSFLEDDTSAALQEQQQPPALMRQLTFSRLKLMQPISTTDIPASH